MEGQGGPRLEGVSVSKGFIMGTYAFRLLAQEGNPVEEMTHKWTALIRASNNENLATYVSKVVFELDPTFVNPRRVVTAPPFEVQEVGWGEFTITARIHFLDPTIPPLRMTHGLKLNTDPGTTSVHGCVVAETAEGLLITDPYEWFYESLITKPELYLPHPLEPYFLSQESRQQRLMEHFKNCQAYIRSETARLMSYCTHTTQDIHTLQREYFAAQNIQYNDASHGAHHRA